MNTDCLKNSVSQEEKKLKSQSIIIEKQAIEKIPDILKKCNTRRVFVLTDKNAYHAAGERILSILKNSEIDYSEFMFCEDKTEPDEQAVGRAVMHYDGRCDTILAVGSGVINDIGKILAHITGKTYIIFATAPSMDGYASATSSMALEGVKVSVLSKSADIIIGDIDILRNAPLVMLKAGLGDMLAKYVSICEWRIAHIVTGEYYCESIAASVREAVKKCVENAEGLLKREETAVKAVFEGLILCGCAMSRAGTSRPASGIEHYFSHIWDMRGLAWNTPVALHGLQCAAATLLTIRLYEKMHDITPDKENAIRYVRAFDFAGWSEQLRRFLGKGAEGMIEQEEKEKKYSIDKHKIRLERIIENWEAILQVIDEELPNAEAIAKLLRKLDMPEDCEAMGISKELLPMTFCATKDIRDKYVLSRLAWDLGIIDEIAQNLI